MLHPVLRSPLQPVLRSPFSAVAPAPFNKFISAMLSKSGRVAAYYGESWDEILAYNAVQVAAGTPANCVAFEDSAGTIPLVAPLGSGKGCGLLKDRSGGNHHRIQTSATARGEMSRRVNLCTGDSERVSSAAPWSSYNFDLADNQIAPPAGYSNCTRITATEAGAATAAYLGNAPYATTPLNMQLVVHTGNRATTSLLLLNATTSTPISAATMNSDGTWIGAHDGFVATPLGDGWFLVELVNTGNISANDYLVFFYGATDVVPPGDYWYVTGLQWQWGEKTRYQRVTSASDYDEEGFPARWTVKTDDWSKSSLNPIGANRAFVLMALRVDSSATLGVIAEYGPTAASTDGTFSLEILSGQITLRVRGASAGATVSATVADTNYAVVGALIDLASPRQELFVNGVSAGVSTATIGATTFVARDLFVGARNGTSAFADAGYTAPLMAVFMQPGDPGLTSTEIARLSSQFNKSIKAY